LPLRSRRANRRRGRGWAGRGGGWATRVSAQRRCRAHGDRGRAPIPRRPRSLCIGNEKVAVWVRRGPPERTSIGSPCQLGGTAGRPGTPSCRSVPGKPGRGRREGSAQLAGIYGSAIAGYRPGRSIGRYRAHRQLPAIDRSRSSGWAKSQVNGHRPEIRSAQRWADFESYAGVASEPPGREVDRFCDRRGRRAVQVVRLRPVGPAGRAAAAGRGATTRGDTVGGDTAARGAGRTAVVRRTCHAAAAVVRRPCHAAAGARADLRLGLTPACAGRIDAGVAALPGWRGRTGARAGVVGSAAGAARAISVSLA
jgi:hypothetical protein